MFQRPALMLYGVYFTEVRWRKDLYECSVIHNWHTQEQIMSYFFYFEVVVMYNASFHLATFVYLQTLYVKQYLKIRVELQLQSN